MYDSILVPLDGSKRAEAILPHVEELTRSSRAKVVLLTAIEQKVYVSAEGVPSQPDPNEVEARAKKAESYLAELTDSLRQQDINTEYRVVYGPAVEAITTVAEEEKAGLIAIASHGRTGLSRVFYGSITAGLLQAVDRPLLLIRSRGLKSDATVEWGKDVI